MIAIFLCPREYNFSLIFSVLKLSDTYVLKIYSPAKLIEGADEDGDIVTVFVLSAIGAATSVVLLHVPPIIKSTLSIFVNLFIAFIVSCVLHDC
jgi:hypothetical protein